MKSPKKPAKSAVDNKKVNDIPVEQPEILNKIEDLKEQSHSSLSIGAGDTISKITHALGIKECGACIKRKEILNRAFSYLQISRDVTDEEVKFIEKLNFRPGYIAEPDIKPLFELYNSLYRKTLSPCRCGGVIQQMMNEINRSFKYYRDDSSKGN